MNETSSFHFHCKVYSVYLVMHMTSLTLGVLIHCLGGVVLLLLQAIFEMHYCKDLKDCFPANVLPCNL